MECKHTWLSMEHVRKGLTRIKCNECDKTMGVFEETEMQDDSTSRRSINFTISGNHFDMTVPIEELLDDMMREMNEKEAEIENKILSGIYSQPYNGDKEIEGEVRELSQDEREELK